MTNIKSIFTRQMRKEIVELLRNGIHASNVPYYMDLYIDNILYSDYEELPPAAKIELCTMEADIYLREFGNTSQKERKLIKDYARLGYSVYEYDDSCMKDGTDMLTVIRFWEELSQSEENTRHVASTLDSDDDLPF